MSESGATSHVPPASSSSESGAAPLFSLIMPVYGVEAYIMDSIADILCQSFRDFELIIVDDASPDHSADIASDLCEDDSRVTILHHNQNSGVSEARNTGIRAARGAWLMFPDPDDRYDERMLERVARIIDERNPDLVVFAHTQEYFDADGSFLYSNSMPLEDAFIADESQIGRTALALEKGTHLGYPWNKAYRRDIIRESELSFETVPYIEDILFNLSYLEHVESLALSSDQPYHYAKRISANLTNATDQRYFDVHRRRIASVYAMLRARGCMDDAAKATLGSLYARYILSALERNCASDSGMGTHDRAKWLSDLYQDDLFCELIPLAQSDESRALELCISLLRAHNTAGLLAAGRTIHIVRAHSTTLYTKARSKR